MDINSDKFKAKIGDALLRGRIFGEIYSFDSPTSGTYVFKVNNTKLIALVKEIAKGMPAGGEVKDIEGIEELIKQIIMTDIGSKVP